MIKISFIIPVYNVDKFLARCLDSILDQEVSNDAYEIILVDDGSTDSSIEIAEQYQSRHAHISIYRQANSGQATARNRGIDLAKGEYIFFIDSDDFLIPGCLKRLLVVLSEEKTAMQSKFDNIGVDVITFRSKEGWVTDEMLADLYALETHQSGYLTRIYSGQEYIATFDYNHPVWWYLIRREYILSKGIRFAESTAIEDFPFTTEIFLGAKTVLQTEILAYYYAYNPDSTMRSSSPARAQRLLQGYLSSANSMRALIDQFSNVSSGCMDVLQRQHTGNIVRGIFHSLEHGSLVNTKSLIKMLVFPIALPEWDRNRKSRLCYAVLNRVWLREPIIHAVHSTFGRKLLKKIR